MSSKSALKETKQIQLQKGERFVFETFRKRCKAAGIVDPQAELQRLIDADVIFHPNCTGLLRDTPIFQVA